MTPSWSSSPVLRRRERATAQRQERRPGEQEGSVGLFTLLAGLLFTAVGLAVIVAAADVGVAAARARTAADAAALAAAGASPLAGGDGDLREAASRLADANGARLTACCDARAAGYAHTAGGSGGGWPLVVVEVEVPLRRSVFVTRAVTVRARAGSDLRPTDVR